MTLRFKRFTRPQVLQRVRRELLARFFDQFASQLAGCQIRLPPADLPDDVYYGALARALLEPETLPDDLTEALFAIDEMAGPEGQEQVELALAQAGLDGDYSGEEMALALWLADPGLLSRQHNQQRLRRLSAFEYFGSRLAPDRRQPFTPPGAETIEALTRVLDAWFAVHWRGCQTTRIEWYALGGEYWFLVRHGDPFSRTPKVEAQQTRILHYRPEKDDVVVYSAVHDEIRINSRTKGERDLYVRAFGLCLRGGEEYFSAVNTYTLEPLRQGGAEALDASGIDGIDKVVLRELEVAWDHHPQRPRTVHIADDLFVAARDGQEVVPEDGRLARAEFDFYFSSAPKPCSVQIRPPNLLKLGRHCDAVVVDQWLCRQRYRSALEIQGGGDVLP